MYLGKTYYCLAVYYNRLYRHKEGSEEFKTKARDHAKQAIRLAPNNAEAHYVLAFVLDSRRHRDEIVFELKKAVELKPDYTDALWDLGIFLVENDQTLEEGIELMKRAIAGIDNPDLTIGKRGRLADLLSAKGRYREALQWYKTLLPSQAVEEIIRDLKKKIEQQEQHD